MFLIRYYLETGVKEINIETNYRSVFFGKQDVKFICIYRLMQEEESSVSRNKIQYYTIV